MPLLLFDLGVESYSQIGRTQEEDFIDLGLIYIAFWCCYIA